MGIFDIQKVQVFLLSIILKVIYSLNRKSVKGRGNYVNNIQAGRPVIIAVWHGHLLSIVHDLRNEKVDAVAGTHKDADLISKVAEKWGWSMIRGSSKEKGSIAYKGMIKSLNIPVSILFITPDGPTGPRRIPKPGIIRAAQATNAVIIPTTVFSTKNWGFTNWDTFFVPKPFGRIEIIYGDPIYFNKNQSFDDCLSIIKESMDKLEQIVDKRILV